MNAKQREDIRVKAILKKVEKIKQEYRDEVGYGFCASFVKDKDRLTWVAAKNTIRSLHEKAYCSYPDNTTLLTSYGDFYHDNLGDYPTALYYLGQAAKLEPNVSLHQANMAICINSILKYRSEHYANEDLKEEAWRCMHAAAEKAVELDYRCLPKMIPILELQFMADYREKIATFNALEKEIKDKAAFAGARKIQSLIDSGKLKIKEVDQLVNFDVRSEVIRTWKKTYLSPKKKTLHPGWLLLASGIGAGLAHSTIKDKVVASSLTVQQ